MHRFFFILLFIFLLPTTIFCGEAVKGLNISTPLLFSGTLGYRFDYDEDPGMAPVFEVEAGVGGGKLLLGFDSMDQGLGVGLKGAYLSTWFEPVNVKSGQRYLGFELQAGNRAFLGSLGLYGRIEGDDDSFLTTLSIGIRF